MSEQITSFSDFSAQKSFTLASYSSSLFSAVGGALTLNDIAILLGIVVALLTFAINWVYQARRDQRERVLHLINIEVAKKELAQQHLTNGEAQQPKTSSKDKAA